jgi:hypothetical protein
VVCNRNGKTIASSRNWKDQADVLTNTLCRNRSLPAGLQSRLKKIIEENTENVEENKEKKEQVVETTCGSHEKTSKDDFYKIRGSRPLD